MKKGNNGLAVAFIIIGICLTGLSSCDSEETCIKTGCDNEQSYGSCYCYMHKPSTSSKSYKSNTSNTNYNSSSSSSSGSTSKKSSYTNSYDSYDDGYEDVYENEDYDWDRYWEDDDYADGVNDAMDELGW